MKLNNLFFLDPPSEHTDLKQLIAFIVEYGVGRPASSPHKAVSSWTADLLADAILETDSSGKGVDIRTINYWIEQNQKGINPKNIRLLAKVVSCGDEAAFHSWRSALSKANQRLRNKQNKQEAIVHPPSPDNQIAARKIGLIWADRTERMFDVPSVLHLPIYVWAGCLGIGISAYLLGLHDVRYTLDSGVEKQVGYFWSPNWTVQQLILIPFILVTVSAILGRWKNDLRPYLGALPNRSGPTDWYSFVRSFNPAFWMVVFLPLGMVFGMQWFGIYLPGLLYGDAGNVAIDWMLAAPYRTDRSIMPAVVVSFFAMIYSSATFWMFLASLLLQYIVATDLMRFRSLRRNLNNEKAELVILSLRAISFDAFKCAILGILMASCIKLNGAYMISNSPHIFTWIFEDMMATFGIHGSTASKIPLNPLQYFTSTILVCLSCFVFFVVLKSTSRASIRLLGNYSVQDPSTRNITKDHAIPVKQMMSVILLLVTNFLLLGQVAGFSIVLVLSLIVALYFLLLAKPYSEDAIQKVLSFGS
ncbi:hypothetical protein WG622_17375 [Cognatishimia sp. D5M38]|uniref:Transmembrane protein n=1 Tax=Cognatishimia coralii TaxID=3083254 RepID=A0ABU8QKT2_9RHOB